MAYFSISDSFDDLFIKHHPVFPSRSHMLILCHERTEVYNPVVLTVAHVLKNLGSLFEKCREEVYNSKLNRFGIHFCNAGYEEVANIAIRRGIAYKGGSAGPEGKSDKQTFIVFPTQINGEHKEMLGEFIQQARLAHPRGLYN